MTQSASKFEHDRIEEICFKIDLFFATYRKARRILSKQKEMVDLSQQLWKTGPVRDRSHFNTSTLR